MTATKEATERALEGAIEEVYGLAKQLGLGGINIQAHPDLHVGYAAAFEIDNYEEIYVYKRIDFDGEVV